MSEIDPPETPDASTSGEALEPADIDGATVGKVHYHETGEEVTISVATLTVTQPTVDNLAHLAFMVGRQPGRFGSNRPDSDVVKSHLVIFAFEEAEYVDDFVDMMARAMPEYFQERHG